MRTYECPFCHQRLIFTGKRTEDVGCKDLGASFFACGCGNNIVSKAFLNRDGSPRIFYDNKWRLNVDGSWWFYHTPKKSRGRWTKVLKAIPKQMRFIFR